MVSLKGIDPAPSGAGPGSGSHERSGPIITVVRRNNKWAAHVWRWALLVREVEAATTKNAGAPEANKVSPLRRAADGVDVELREMASTPTAVKQKKPKRKKAQVKPAPATTTWWASLLEGAAVLVLGLLLAVEMNGPAIRIPVHGTKATGAGGLVRRPPPLAPASFEELVSFDGCLEHGAADGSGPAGSPLSVDGVCEEPPRPLQPVIGGLVVEALGVGTRVEALPDVVRAQPGASEFPVANLVGPDAGVDYEADSVAAPYPCSSAEKCGSGAPLLPLRRVVGGFVVEAPELGTAAADAVSHQCSKGFSGDDCTSPASSPPQEDEPVAWASIDTGGAGEKKGGGLGKSGWLGQATCAFLAAISSRRQAVAIFVFAAMPAMGSEVPGVFTDNAALRAAVDDLATAEATHGPIAGWDVSRVDDMSEVFQHKNAFNDDIGAWDTSRVTNMQQTLKGASAFNLELAWDTSKVTNMESIMQIARAFSQPLVWDTSKVTNLKSAWQAAESFNGELNWDTSSVTLLERTLYQASAFNRPLVWDVSKVTTMPNMLRETSFNQPASLAAWDVSKASAMTDMLTGSALASDECSKVQVRVAWQDVTAFTYDWSAAVCPGVFFDGDSLKAAVADVTAAEATHGSISGWDVSQVDNMDNLFEGKGSFNGDISKWDTGSVTNMFGTFNGADAFNRQLVWDTSSVTNMVFTFEGASAFNQKLAWDTSKVTDMEYACSGARAFNSELAWDTAPAHPRVRRCQPRSPHIDGAIVHRAEVQRHVRYGP